MIFVLHYILFSSGLSFVVIIQSLFLQTYSDASLVEIGALLMALPFISIFARPFFCALADRHQAHQIYLIGACFALALGYGSLAVAPFFPDFIGKHGRLIWYLDIIGIVIGYTAFSVVFSLGDALALNAARRRGISWSLYRVWSTLSWGVFGYLIGLINETPGLPKYVPGIFVLIASMFLEMALVAVWNKRAFDMNDHSSSAEQKNVVGDQKKTSIGLNSPTIEGKSGVVSAADHRLEDAEEKWAPSPFGTASGFSARLMGALAGVVVEDIGSTIKSSLTSRQGGQKKRVALAEMLEQHGADMMINSPKSTIRASALSRQLSLASEASDLDGRKNSNTKQKNSITSAGSARSFGSANGRKLRAQMETDELNSTVKQTDKQSNSPRPSLAIIKSKPSIPGKPSDLENLPDESIAPEYSDDLQMLLLKFIVRRDRTIIKSLFLFTLFGFLMSVHYSYFFLHVEQVCRLSGYNFSNIMGAMVAAQSVSEIFSFIFMVRYYMPLVGRIGSLLSCAFLFGARFAYYGSYFAVMSPYLALVTEAMHGLAYAMLYTLICDCASDCVEQLGQHLPELILRGLIDPSISENQLKLPLRATMQGVFSGAFDGLGYGLGALFGGLFLEFTKDYVGLWQVSTGISIATLLYILVTCRGQARTSSAGAC